MKLPLCTLLQKLTRKLYEITVALCLRMSVGRQITRAIGLAAPALELAVDLIIGLAKSSRTTRLLRKMTQPFARCARLFLVRSSRVTTNSLGHSANQTAHLKNESPEPLIREN